MEGLTDKQSEVLAYLDRYIAANGKSPSVRETMEGVGIVSTSRVHALLYALNERGFIRRLPGRARSITILRRPGDMDPPFPGPPVLSRATDEDLHRLRRDLAMEITRRTNDKAIARADAITGRSA